jgi:hypothetical protein
VLRLVGREAEEDLGDDVVDQVGLRRRRRRHGRRMRGFEWVSGFFLMASGLRRGEERGREGAARPLGWAQPGF